MKKDLRFKTRSAVETRELGIKIGEFLFPGAILLLIGDLGSGKTTLVQGIAKGLKVPEQYYITSPSYTLINEYPGNYPLFHVDVYRLDNAADIDEIGLLDIFNSNAVVVIEWADKLHEDDIPDEHIVVRITATQDDEREIRVIAYGHKEINLLKDVDQELKN